ncbi:hypothetical protein PRUPE_3G129700 [Prunus persica]|uniref:Uncharacterized protein n=1 Tax=Prunus persica TaxID=3760 RepID=A0A251PZB5_PRUPE|nr:hypothetical protein PRUPE_3G129700 [Prunus persica]ONI16917.1 hypothetical protein PRUPE_3G129700 [Prunus persica]
MMVRDTSFRREGADIHVDVGLCITQVLVKYFSFLKFFICFNTRNS